MSNRERSWPVPVVLVALSAIPLTAGTLRLIQLASVPTGRSLSQLSNLPTKPEHSHEHRTHDIRDPRPRPPR